MLSSCLLISSIYPFDVKAEMVNEVSSVSEQDTLDTLIEEDEADEIESEKIDEIEEEYISSEVETDADDEQLIEAEYNSDVYSDNEIVAFESGNEDIEDEYTQVADNIPIEFKYNGTTLNFRLMSGVTSCEMPNLSSMRAAKWVDEYQDQAKTVTKIVIGDGITSIGKSNFECRYGFFEKLSEVDLPASVQMIGNAAFQNDSVLKTIDLSNIKSIGMSALAGTQIEKIDFEADTVTLKSGAFENCKALSSVTGKVITLDEEVFSGCENLSNYKTESNPKNIPYFAFSSTKLSEFDFSGVETIDMLAFMGAPLKKISFDSIKSIDYGAFDSCENLTSICYQGTKSEWSTVIESADLSSAVKVHCRGEEKPKVATCTEDGDKTSVCEVCNETYKDDENGTANQALGHKWEMKVDQEPTCTEAGSESNHCTRCDATEPDSTTEIPALGHDYVSKVTTQPTCTKEGVSTLTCSRCKDTKTEAIPATGVHQWSNWKKTADATVFAPEQQERSCTICGKTETQTVGSKLSATATVNVSSVTLKVKQNTSSVKVTGLAKGDSVKTWKSTNTKVFKVTGKADGTCKLTGVKKGTAKLEITLASGLKKTVTVKVQAKTVKTSKISGLAKKMTVQKGAKATLKPVITPATSQQKVTYSSSNKKVATVSSKGIITAKKAGTAKITVKSGSKKVTVTVTVPKTKTTAITVGEKASVKKGKTYSLKAKVVPSNSDEKITYSTSNKKIATVSKSGKIKGMKKGTATITIKSGKVTKKVKVTVK